MGLTVGKERGKRNGELGSLTLHKVCSYIAHFVNVIIQVYSGTLIVRSLCVAATSLWWPHCWSLYEYCTMPDQSHPWEIQIKIMDNKISK